MPTSKQGHPADPAQWREIHLAGTNEPLHAIANGSRIVPYEGGATRARSVHDELQARIDDGLVDQFFAGLRDALGAVIWTRGPGENGRTTYLLMPDHASRLTAIRLGLAYKYGNPVSASEVRLLRAPTDEPTRLSPEEQLRELRATGIDLENVVKTWLRGLDDVTPSDKKPKTPAENAETGPTAPLADAFLDV